MVVNKAEPKTNPDRIIEASLKFDRPILLELTGLGVDRVVGETLIGSGKVEWGSSVTGAAGAKSDL